ncbi:MAG: hypothetical protein GEU94_15365 [Micromonosporaceae bacterium]|nr:hypothetical protein [Micromonosporaceae bacterium]
MNATNDIANLLAEEAEAAEAGRDLPYSKVHRVRRQTDDPAQVFSVRIPKSRMDELRRIAHEQHTTPGALMRSWVLERLDGTSTTVDLDAVRQVVREELSAFK